MYASLWQDFDVKQLISEYLNTKKKWNKTVGIKQANNIENNVTISWQFIL